MSDSDPSANLFEDANASHPLDLLINAISGSGQYQIPAEARDGHGGFDLEQLLSGSHAQQDSNEGNDKTGEHDGSGSRKRARSPGSGREGHRGSKVAKIVKEHVVHFSNIGNRDISQADGSGQGAGSGSASAPSSFSTIEVWHPTAGQKSYGKERRMLNPPPILRVTGPLLPLLTQATLRTVLCDADPSGDLGVLSTQCQRIPLNHPAPVSPPLIAQQGIKARRAEKEDKARKLREQASKHGFGQTLPYERNKHTSREREALSDGLIFPGLWVAEGIGKEKEFRLELSLGMPGVEDTGEAAPVLNVNAKRDEAMGDNIDPALGGPSDVRQDDQTTGDNLFGDHQTLEQASSEIINQMTEEDRRLFETAQQTGTDPATGTQEGQLATENAIAPESIPRQPLAPTSPQRWATITSSTLSVVSKPSQKTAKARSMDSCLAMDDSFALWVRINGQTVRTKYMKLDEGDSPRLTSRTTQWSPFKFEIIERAAPIYSVPDRSANPRDRSKGFQSDRILTYGSIGCLVDLQSGVKTESMRLVKIDKNENVVGTDFGHPVSDLQRVGFLRLVNGQDDYTGGGRWYLSAPGARLGGAELHAASGSRTRKELEEGQESEAGPKIEGTTAEGSTVKGKPRKKKTKRFALAEAVVAEDAGGAEFTLSWSKADRHEGERSRGFGKDIVKKVETCEKVEDWMCWVIGGVSNFTCSVFDGYQSGSLYHTSIEPVLRNLAPPVFDAESNSLVLTLNEFFDTTHSHDPSASFEVYLGPIGPVHTSLYRSVAPEKAGADNGHSSHFLAEPFGPEPFDEDGIPHPVRSDYPSHKPHVIVVVGMPPAETIIRTMQECFAEAQYQATSTLHSLPSHIPADSGAEAGAEAEAQGWLSTNDVNNSEHVYIHDTVTATGPTAPITTQGSGGGAETPAQAPVDQSQDLALDPALSSDLENQSQGQAQTQHNVDDITAALAAHASDPGFSLSQIDEHSFLAANLDPALNDPSSEMQEYQNQVYEPANPPELELRKSDQGNKKIEMVPLPIVVVRLSDGVGFSVGRNVVAERVDSKGPGEKPRWGLRIVEG